MQGEDVQKMDSIANRIMIYRMERCGALCAMSSEEEAELIKVGPEFPRGDYILIFDPLDGSSNIDINVDVGTIFSILRRPAGSKGEVTLEDVLQPGIQQVGAGYILYGPSTMLVLSTGQGVHGFTLDPGVGEFLLSHPDMQIPEQGYIYSVNEGYWRYWDQPAREAVKHFHNAYSPDGKPYTARYVGALVADFHRTLLRGGIYMYPADQRKPEGKLRLMCEANPLAFLAEQAGGRASDGKNRFTRIMTRAELAFLERFFTEFGQCLTPALSVKERTGISRGHRIPRSGKFALPPGYLPNAKMLVDALPRY